MRSLIKGRIVLGKSFDIQTREIPALKLKRVGTDELYLETVWGRKVLEISQRNGGYYLAPDQCGALPIFAYSHEETLYFANNINELMEMVPRDKQFDIDKNNVLKTALMEGVDSGETILKGVRVVNGPKQLFWNGGPLQLVEYDYPQSKEAITNIDLPTLLQQSLAWTKQFKPGEIGVTLSGGIDSAVIWAGLLSLGVKPVALTMMFPGEMGRRQTTKIEQMVKSSQAKWLQVYADDLRFMSSPYMLYENMYGQLWTKLGQMAKDTDVKVILGGTGGDELAANSRHKLVRLVQQTKKLPGFFTPQVVKAWESLTPNTKEPKLGLLPISVYNPTGAVPGQSFQQDLWFENTLCYPDFWYWTEQQDKSWGEDKQGFRDYLKNAGFDLVADSTINEDFQDIFVEANKQSVLSEHFDLLFKHSVLTEWGWLNKDKIFEIKNSVNDTDLDTLTNLYFVYSLESMLQYTQYMYQKEVSHADTRN